jgi:hypothetical protein
MAIAALAMASGTNGPVQCRDWNVPFGQWPRPQIHQPWLPVATAMASAPEERSTLTLAMASAPLAMAIAAKE